MEKLSIAAQITKSVVLIVNSEVNEKLTFDLTSRTKKLSVFTFFLKWYISAPGTAPVLKVAPLDSAESASPSPTLGGHSALTSCAPGLFVDFTPFQEPITPPLVLP